MHLASVVFALFGVFFGDFDIDFLFIIGACLLFLALDNGEISSICLIISFLSKTRSISIYSKLNHDYWILACESSNQDIKL